MGNVENASNNSGAASAAAVSDPVGDGAGGWGMTL